MSSNIKRLLLFLICGAVPITVFLQLPMGTWADFGGLPNHPLVVHLIVVAVPIVALWAIVAAWKPKVLDATFPFLYGSAVLCALATIVAKSSGDSLAAAVGLPKAHAAAGDRMVSFTIALTGIILVMSAVRRLWSIRFLTLASQVLMTVVGLIALPLTYVAGHSGAEATWEQAYAEAQQPIQPSEVAHTLADVQKRSTAQECWTIVDGVVYDVSSFIARHPAGSQDIVEMCGKDSSENFLGQHQGQGEPEKWLATLRIGTVTP